ncbi:MAG: hypothetical protein SO314_07295 [Alphaproteobacteria bacterium]|nr:hypothetical protein [Alphaproteobacteria bacterium]
MKHIIAIFIMAIYLSSCTTHITDLSMISNKNINLNRVNIDTLSQKKNVEGEDSKFVFLFIPFGQPTLKGALNDALEKGQGDLMVDASVYVTSWWFLIGETGIKIKGDVVNTKGVVNK